jgi:uncharacterized membrane protein
VADDNKSLPTLATELWEMVLTYLKQETVEPIKAIGRFLAYGVAGAFAFALGLVLLLVAGLRLLQTETEDHFTGSLTWVPYAIVFAAAILVAAIFGRTISARKRAAAKKGTVA